MRTGIIGVTFIHVLFTIQTKTSGGLSDLHRFCEQTKGRKRTRNLDHYVRGKQWQLAAENCVMRNIVILNDNQISGDQRKKNEIGGACEHCGGEGEARAGFWWGI